MSGERNGEGGPIRVLLAAEHGEGEPFLRAVAGVELSVVAQSSPEFEPAMSGMDAVVTSALTPSQMAAAEGVRVIHTPGAGIERFPVDALPDGC